MSARSDTILKRAPIRRSLLRLLALVLLGAAAGCAPPSLMLEPEADVPVPLANQLPLKIAVHYPEAFRNYVYEEDSEDRQNWSIRCGPSQVALFDQVLPSLFATVVHADGTSYAGDPELAAILVPRVDDIQFALPQETRTDLYEAWIRYSIALYAPDGQLIAEFPVSGYGKATTSLFTARDDGLNSAINSAFRDVGAKLTLGFAQQAAVRPWLAAKQAELQNQNRLQ